MVSLSITVRATDERMRFMATRFGGNPDRRIPVLIVDDSPMAQKAVQATLDTEPAVAVVGTASCGREALDKARELSPDLVLLDIRMPGTSGIETLNRLRRLYPAIRVIVVTSYDSAEVREACKKSGAHGFVSKDRLHQELVAEIKHVFGGPATGSNPDVHS